ncbi:hypothetical protein ACN28S_11475 [Cystobacter fuscus]
MKRTTAISLAFATGIAVGLSIFFWRTGQMEERGQIHVLETPLKIATDTQAKQYYLLPAGTTLYYDGAMPEGFTRYKVYVNIEGKALSLAPMEKPGLIAPLTAYPLDKDELLALLAAYPLDKEDLTRILHSIPATRRDIIEILNSYKEP